ncbi:phosphonate C-P lyase system protein PhnH [Kyrpidia tusciae]|uniref:Phosphonate C-P lyase system protein PhnH n=1 Tax=Kyrpidia tusciae (strain DSM 2912 / NBRC 15312 / T2) TaxID=562970 RepID=D5WWE9_KYRT2|nr:phosphonate C-P lyase system protein PhnH [Kyrpidia tusciae]ADG07714.1 phosphonate C-P lyase system protein PhnH [Kyrpidia tusciae DSM 2912]
MAEVQFDEVRYTQVLFRQLLDAMARPGKPVAVEPAPGEPGPWGIPKSRGHRCVLGIGLTLLDPETTFWLPESDRGFGTLLQRHTRSRTASVDRCDFAFVQGEQRFPIERLPRGTFTYPDRSATVVCRVRRFAREPFPADRLIHVTLRGPGIPGERRLYIDTVHPDTLGAWREINREFPLGLDWILVDGFGFVCGVPRSTSLEWEVL